MQATYTDNLHLAKPQTGDKDWGAAINANFDMLAQHCAPSLQGQAGKFLFTDGAAISWQPLDGGTF